MVAIKKLDLKNNRVTILGGTGTLGQALVARLLNESPNIQISILSRDEHKQANMRKRFPTLSYHLGDIRDPRTYFGLFEKRDAVFHVAALKHVDLLEQSPFESVKTNIIATESLARHACAARVPNFIFSSTDKAVDPINVYGYSKAISEKILFNLNSQQNSTHFSVYRWGNVVGSQGSVIPHFAKTLREDGVAHITHPEMTRFWLKIEDAVEYMIQTYAKSSRSEAMVPLALMKAAPVQHVIQAIAEILGIKTFTILNTGMRPGEKIHEVMSSQHSNLQIASNTVDRYSKQELIELIYPILKAVYPMELAA